MGLWSMYAASDEACTQFGTSTMPADAVYQWKPAKGSSFRY